MRPRPIARIPAGAEQGREDPRDRLLREAERLGRPVELHLAHRPRRARRAGARQHVPLSLVERPEGSAWSSPTTPSTSISSSRSRPSRRARCSTTTSSGGRRDATCASTGSSFTTRGAPRRATTRPRQVLGHRRASAATTSSRPKNFDYVVVATGHFSVPNVPHFDGIETLPRPRPARARLPRRRRVHRQGPAHRRRQLLGRGHRAAVPQIRGEVRHHVLAHEADGLQMAGGHGRAAAARPRSRARRCTSRTARARRSTPSSCAPAISTTSRSWTTS